MRSAQADNALLRAQIQQLRTKLQRPRTAQRQVKVVKHAPVAEVVRVRRRCKECESLLIAGHSSVSCKKHWLHAY
jgi:hypothetical protein